MKQGRKKRISLGSFYDPKIPSILNACLKKPRQIVGVKCLTIKNLEMGFDLGIGFVCRTKDREFTKK